LSDLGRVDGDVFEFTFAGSDSRNDEPTEPTFEGLRHKCDAWRGSGPKDSLIGCIGPVRSRRCGPFDQKNLRDIVRIGSANRKR